MSRLSDAWTGVKNVFGVGPRKTVTATPQEQQKYEFGRSEEMGRIEAQNMRVTEREAQQRRAPDLDWSQANQSRDQAGQARAQQQGLVNAYQGTIDGTRQSLAQAQLQAGQAQAAQQAASLAAGARGGGGNAILAQKEAQKQASLGQLAVSRDAAQLRSQEVSQAMQAQGGLLSAMRQGDQAQQGADISRQELQSQNALTQRGLNDAQSRAYLASRMGLYESQLQADMAYDRARTGGQDAANQANASAYNSALDSRFRAWLALASSGASAAAASAAK